MVVFLATEAEQYAESWGYTLCLALHLEESTYRCTDGTTTVQRNWVCGCPVTPPPGVCYGPHFNEPCDPFGPEGDCCEGVCVWNDPIPDPSTSGLPSPEGPPDPFPRGVCRAGRMGPGSPSQPTTPAPPPPPSCTAYTGEYCFSSMDCCGSGTCLPGSDSPTGEPSCIGGTPRPEPPPPRSE